MMGGRKGSKNTVNKTKLNAFRAQAVSCIPKRFGAYTTQSKNASVIFRSWRQGFHAVLKVLDFEICFQDLEKVLNLAKMFIKYWKSMEILNSAIWLYKFCNLPLMTVLRVFCNAFYQ